MGDIEDERRRSPSTSPIRPSGTFPLRGKVFTYSAGTASLLNTGFFSESTSASLPSVGSTST